MAKGATQIMVIRHAEKPGTYSGQAYSGVDALGDTSGSDGEESLVTIGWERAGGLVTLFAPPWGPKAPLQQPAFLYASDPASDGGKEPSQRPYQTVTAVAAMLGLKIDSKHKKGDYDKVVSDALAKDGVVLICWQHEDIVAIGQSILSQTNTAGINLPPSWPDGPNGARYDLVWVFDRPSGSGPITAFTQVAQLLLPGDEPAPA